MVHIYRWRQRLEGFENEILKIVSYGATPDQWEAWLQVPLEHAATRGNLDLATRLLEAGAGERVSGWRGCRCRTVLDAAALGGNAEVVSALLLHKARSDLNVVSVSSGRSALYLAVVCGHEAAARELILGGHDVNHRDPTDKCGPLYTAVSDGHEQLVGDLLEAGANPDARHGGDEGYTPLHIACSRGHMGIISALLAGGADKDVPDNHGALPLHHAISQDHVAAAESLLAAGANVMAGGRFRPFVLAACKGNAETLKVFIKHGVDVNFRDDLGSTALHAAAHGCCHSSSPYSASATAVHALIDAGAEANVQRFDGGAPLHYAAAFASCSSRFEIMLALVQRGASVDLVHSITAQTPLHVACQHKKRGVDAVVDLLLRWGADETAVGGDGRTASELLELDMNGGRVATATSPGDERQEDLAHDDEVDRARALLARAGEDRAWRRRFLPVMLRWREGKARATHTSSNGIIITGSSGGSSCTATSRGGRDYETTETGPTGPATALNQGDISGAGVAPDIDVNSITTGNVVDTDTAGAEEPRGCEGGGGTSNRGGRDEGSGQEEHLGGVMALLVGVASEGVFRVIVGFL